MHDDTAAPRAHWTPLLTGFSLLLVACGARLALISTARFRRGRDRDVPDGLREAGSPAGARLVVVPGPIAVWAMP